MVPVIIYFRCVHFRKTYNVDRILSAKQLDLLKRIHSKSSSLVKQLGRRRNDLDIDDSVPTPIVNVIPPAGLEEIIGGVMVAVEGNPSLSINGEIEQSEENIEKMIQDYEANLDQIISLNVPDPDQEDVESGRLDPSQSLVSRLTTMARKRVPTGRSVESQEYEFNLNVLPAKKLELAKSLPREATFFDSIQKPISLPRLLPSDEPRFGALGSQATIPRAGSVDEAGVTISNYDEHSDHSLLDVPMNEFSRNRHSTDGSVNSLSVNATGGLERLKTLQTHPNFRSPAFRSVPKWMPIRGYEMAWIVLIITTIVTIGNIVIGCLPSSS